ncbi:hypothetical protein SPSIL_057670 [Sporomusa silvacetica DSM 10669]|uniref:Preprotein translocase subunit SecE n=1 Tax=Sporomusa silvacetica DSM 10669 TaxID=1123289 RepID=A0ABZ3IVJ0_9FIRM|nr:hypothetical protein SPSIL_50120 [Sporomusa silvacetica DSM 10669]
MEILETIAKTVFVVVGICLVAIAYFELVSFPWQ